MIVEGLEGLESETGDEDEEARPADSTSPDGHVAAIRTVGRGWK